MNRGIIPWIAKSENNRLILGYRLVTKPHPSNKVRSKMGEKCQWFMSREKANIELHQIVPLPATASSPSGNNQHDRKPVTRKRTVAVTDGKNPDYMSSPIASTSSSGGVTKSKLKKLATKNFSRYYFLSTENFESTFITYSFLAMAARPRPATITPTITGMSILRFHLII